MQTTWYLEKSKQFKPFSYFGAVRVPTNDSSPTRGTRTHTKLKKGTQRMPSQALRLKVWTLSIDERRHVVCATREKGGRAGARIKCCRKSAALVPIDDGAADYPDAIVLIRLRPDAASSFPTSARWKSVHLFRNWDNADVVDGPLLAVMERQAEAMARRLLPPLPLQPSRAAAREEGAAARQARMLREARRMHIQL